MSDVIVSEQMEEQQQLKREKKSFSSKSRLNGEKIEKKAAKRKIFLL
jgi:hypothetical protein